VNIAELKRKSATELQEMADSAGLEDQSGGGLRKQDLIFKIEQSLLDKGEVLTGEGVLEVLPEGYGFLRSPDWNYLSVADQALRPAHRRHRSRPSASAEGVGAVSGAPQGGIDQRG
jgi:transcription termination factor Rho